MFIQTQETPNPNTLKFLPGQIVLAEGTAEFTLGQSCETSPFAQRLLAIEGVTGVFFGQDFISVTKQEDLEWYSLKPSILGIIMEQFVANLPVITTALSSFESEDVKEEDKEIIFQIKELLDTRVRPAVAQDGGDITFHSFKEGVVTLTLKGACSGCPSSTATLKSGIENMLKYYIPEIKEVQASA